MVPNCLANSGRQRKIWVSHRRCSSTSRGGSGLQVLEIWKLNHFLVNYFDGTNNWKPFVFLPTGKEVWDSENTQIFRIPLRFTAWNQILGNSKEGDRDMTTNYNELMTLWQDLDLCYEDKCTSLLRCRKMIVRFSFLQVLTKNWMKGQNSQEDSFAHYLWDFSRGTNYWEKKPNKGLWLAS